MAACRTTIRPGQIRRHTSSQTEEDLLKGRYFRASCPVTVAVKDIVYVTGPGVGGLFQVGVVDPRDLSNMPAMGIVFEKQNAGSKCLIMRHGQLNGFTGLTPNAVYFVGLDGRVSKDPPTALPGGRAGVQIVGRALGATVMLIDVADIIIKVRE